MGKAIFLTNPDLNADDVVVTHSSARGRRAGTPIPGPTNSGLMVVTAIGDAGDGLDHVVEIKGQDKFPRYNPRSDAGADRQCSPESFSTLGSVVDSAAAGLAVVEGYDRLHLLTLSDAALLSIYIWDGSAFTLRASQTLDQDVGGGFAACARGDNLYIGVVDPTTDDVSFYSFNTKSFAIRDIVEGGLSVNGPGAIAMASDGAMFVVLHEYLIDSGGNFDVRVAYGGDLARLKQKPHSFRDMFAAAWSDADSIRTPAISWCPEFRFTAAVRADDLARVAHSFDGDDWLEFENIVGAVTHPTLSTGWGSSPNMGLAPEGRRVFFFRGNGTSLIQQHFVGRRVWSAEFDADGGSAPAASSPIATTNWRGTVYTAYVSGGSVVVRRCNELTTSVTGHSRAMELGRRNYVDGPEDDTRTALFFTPRGAVNKGDIFTIPTSYDHRGANVLSEILGETWRANDAGEEWVKFDAGVDRAFSVDAISIFRSNLPSLTLEMDDDPDFTSPPVSETIEATIATASVVSGDRNILTFAAGTFEHYQHAETTRWVKLTSGVSGIFRILDNTDDSLIVDGDVSAATAGTATIFGDRMWLFLDDVETYRYLRLVTPELELPDDYYDIGRVIFGRKFTLPRNFSSGFTRQIAAVESPLQLKAGPRIVTSLNGDRRHTFQLPWQVIKYELGLASLEGFYGRVNGAVGQMAFWPHPSSPVVHQIGMHLCRVEQPMQEQHLNARYFGGGLVLSSEV